MNLASWLLRAFGWRVEITVPLPDKCVIAVAPHTSNWDFVLGMLAYASVGRKPSFLMKEAWFVFPLGMVFRAMGGIPVPRKRGSALTAEVVKRIDQADKIALAVTPEGTRSPVNTWRTGFIHIATEAHVPILLAAIDFKLKLITINATFTPTGNLDKDMAAVKGYYRNVTPKYPDKFAY